MYLKWRKNTVLTGTNHWKFQKMVPSLLKPPFGTFIFNSVKYIFYFAHWSFTCVLRATAFGVLNGICKLAAIISTFIFGKFIGITKIIPIILSFSALVCGGLLAFKLPETREVILQWKSQTPQGLSVWSSWTLDDRMRRLMNTNRKRAEMVLCMLEPPYRSITFIVLLLLS